MHSLQVLLVFVLLIIIAELILAILWMVIGASAFSFTVGNMSSVLANFDSQGAKLTLKMAQLSEFCKDAKIPKALREEMRESVEYTTQKGMFSWMDKQKIFAELPPQIKSEVAKQMYGGMINKVRFFKNKDSTFISLVVPMLQPYKAARKERVYSRDDHPTASISFNKCLIKLNIFYHHNSLFLD